jgi:DNA-binding XRE family transcriptional regulator
MVTAEQIRAARALLRLDQSGLALRAGVSLTTVRRVERGAEKARI